MLNTGSLEQHAALADLIGRGVRDRATALLKRHIAKTRDDYERTLRLGVSTELSYRSGGGATTLARGSDMES